MLNCYKQKLPFDLDILYIIYLYFLSLYVYMRDFYYTFEKSYIRLKCHV